MKKLFTLFAMLMLLGLPGAFAQDGANYNPDDYIDLGELELGKKYDLEAFKKYRGTFTPTFSGTIMLDSPELAFFSSYPPYWSDPDSPEYNMINGTHAGYGAQGSIFSIPVEEGKTIYLSSALLSIMSTKYLQISQEADLEFVSSDPEIDSYYSYTGEGYITLTFNAGVVYPHEYNDDGSSTSIKNNANIRVMHITEGGNNFTTLNYPIYAISAGKDITVYAQDAIRAAILSGEIAKDDIMTVELDGVRDAAGNLYHGDGKFEATYKVPGKAVDIIEDQCHVPAVYKSFNPTDAEDMVLTAVFDGNVSSARAMIEFGIKGTDQDGYFYAEELPAQYITVDGNKIHVNLADGQVRRPDHEMGLQIDISEMNVMLTQVKDENGAYVNSDGQGTQGQFNFTIPFEYVKLNALQSDFTPANGTTLQGATEMKIWINEYKQLKYNGVKFTYSGGECIVPQGDITVALDPEGMNGGEISFALPAELQGKRQIEVRLNELTTPDGLDHNPELLGRYDGFDLIVKVLDAEGQAQDLNQMVYSIKSFTIAAQDFEGSDLSVALSDDYSITLYDMDRQEFPMTCTAAGGVVTASLDEAITTPGRYPFMIGAGSLKIGQSALANDAFSYAVEIPTSSYNPDLDITVDPAPGREYESLPEIQIMFHNKSDIGAGNGNATYTLDGVEMGKVQDGIFDWDIAGLFTLPVNFTQKGHYVITFPEGMFNYSEGDMMFPAFTLEYDITGASTVKVEFEPADQAQVEAGLAQVLLTFPDFEAASPQYGHASMTKDGGEPVDLPDLDFDWNLPENVLIQPVTPALTEEGVYVITWPAQAILLGYDGEAETSEMSVTYYLGDSAVDSLVGEDSALVTVYDYRGVRVLSQAARAELRTLPAGFYIVNGKRVVIR